MQIVRKELSGHTRRKACIDQLAAEAIWDVLVIGGGATGLGTALEAASRGYKTLLLERSDFAKGTSSRSTKLVHGGVRYLAQGNLMLVREASVERGRLQQNAPHLVKNQTFIIPVYSWWESIKYTIGLKLYDWIAGRLSLGASKFIGRTGILQRLPGVKAEGLKGGVEYHDGQFDDSRLAVNLVQTLLELGGDAINYFGVVGLLKNSDGKICGVTALDAETGDKYDISAKAVINATGVFADDVLQMDNPRADKSICVSQGIHLVVDREFYPSPDALMIPATSDGRVLFAVPWHDKVVLGTTDTPVQDSSEEPVALESEIQFILKTAAQYLQKAPARKDVISVFAGLRPLAAPARGEQKTKEISRSHKIDVTASGLFTISGGKWTTYRRMGEDMMNRVESRLGWEKMKGETKDLHIHGYARQKDWDDPFYTYGSDRPAIEKKIASDEEGWISRKAPLHRAQIEWAVNHEMARTVEDVLARRTRLLFLDARLAMDLAPAVARNMASLLDRDAGWEAGQVTQFRRIASNYLIETGEAAGRKKAPPSRSRINQ